MAKTGKQARAAIIKAKAARTQNKYDKAEVGMNALGGMISLVNPLAGAGVSITGTLLLHKNAKAAKEKADADLRMLNSQGGVDSLQQSMAVLSKAHRAASPAGPSRRDQLVAQGEEFRKANAEYAAKLEPGKGGPLVSKHKGWSDEARIKAAEARGVRVLPYGGTPRK